MQLRQIEDVKVPNEEDEHRRRRAGTGAKAVQASSGLAERKIEGDRCTKVANGSGARGYRNKPAKVVGQA